MAFESKDRRTILKAIADIIQACVIEDINVSDLTLYDIEYLFTKIRAKSVGEVVSLVMKCSKCKARNPVETDIDSITYDASNIKLSQKIPLTDTISIEMKTPSYMQLISNDDIMGTEDKFERMEHQIIESMVAIHTPEERINVKEESSESIKNMIEELTTEQFGKLMAFVKATPSLKFSFKFKCVECGHDNDLKAESLEDLF
jgi:ribosomal protein L44E